ncbi:stage II sporulation protein D [Paenibacillus sp. strain BS8-2]
MADSEGALEGIKFKIIDKRGKQWWYVFGVGITLGCVVFGMRLLLVDASANGGTTNKFASADRISEQGLGMVSDSLSGSSIDADDPMSEKPGTIGNNGAGQLLPQTQHISDNLKEPPSITDKTDKPPDLEAQDKPESSVQDSPDDKRDDSAQAAASVGQSALEGVHVRVYLSGQRKVEKVPIETYVMGVLAGEMPIDFELEALKAQAIAARTYIVRRMASGENDMASRGADVSDTIRHQVYVSKKELASRWSGKDKAVNLAKLEQAIRETRGLIVTYEGQPIEAAFFSTSNGFTENSEDYWSLALPYLRSVASPWDKELSPRYEQELTFKVSQFYSAIGLSGKSASAKKPSIKVLDKSDGNRIMLLSINGRSFTGREVRERLGLASSQFSWKISKGSITFTTYGLGHGVGMSQWGANGIAKDGGRAEDILLHYYTGTKVEQASKLPT